MVVLGVQITGQRGTLGTWNPQVGGPGVQDDLKSLSWGTQGDFGEVLSI